MTAILLNSIHSEWLKTKRTAGLWLVIIGGLFIPVIFIAARLIQNDLLPAENRSPQMWNELISVCWQFMSIFLLPMGTILVTSLITQNEFRNNTWKQLHATPQPFIVIFFAKLGVILFLLLCFFILFNIGIYLAGIVPGLFFADVPFPVQPFPWNIIIRDSVNYFIAVLPVLSLQYLLSLQSRNFMLPLGAGIALLVASLVGVQWEHGYTIPYSYSTLRFISTEPGTHITADLNAWSLGYFTLFVTAAFVLYIRKKEKA